MNCGFRPEAAVREPGANVYCAVVAAVDGLRQSEGTSGVRGAATLTSPRRN
jgi:hypothetical protein